MKVAKVAWIYIGVGGLASSKWFPVWRTIKDWKVLYVNQIITVNSGKYFKLKFYWGRKKKKGKIMKKFLTQLQGKADARSTQLFLFSYSYSRFLTGIDKNHFWRFLPCFSSSISAIGEKLKERENVQVAAIGWWRHRSFCSFVINFCYNKALSGDSRFSFAVPL